MADDHRFEVTSAGLHAVVGAPMDRDAAHQLILHGGDPEGLVAKQITVDYPKAANLLLTMTRAQRDELIQKYPLAMHRTFTLSEFAKLSLKLQGSCYSVDELVTRSALHRAQVILGSSDDITDPIGARPRVHENVANQISELVDVISSQLLYVAKIK
ncbi:hypothetical protein AUR04nite_34070 [Glutamicibacter uratoxydans]|uniref:Phosphotyrosine protein phosphatase I domain-containing protein n=1 Tax=Glutamicibacter uratoxydans TaxID=43667 RepID=A0A4Y4DW97_GLUUR|nr:hypothetical protein AUR04nite_34070 [Glutamicibacter uratoxydans]